MLKERFLGILSDCISGLVTKDEKATLKAANQFGMGDLVVENDDEYNKSIGVFSEWIVFDYKQEIFGGTNGLEYFLKNNPLNLGEEDMDEYRGLLEYEVGLFEVGRVEKGLGIVLVSLKSNKEFFVHDITASLTVRSGNTVWARIAPILGIYHMVCCLFVPMPFKFVSEARERVSKEAHVFSARDIAHFVFSKKENANSISKGKEISLQIAEAGFISCLKQCGMENFFTIKRFKRWVVDEKNYGPGFIAKALIFLMPDDRNDLPDAELFDAAMMYINRIPRKFLGGKTPNEAAATLDHKDRQFEVKEYSKDKYIKMLQKASEYMAKGEFQNSYNEFENVIRKLLENKAPFFPCFRVYANAAVCCFRIDDFGMGEVLVEASLRINPSYDFAVRVKEMYLDPYYDPKNIKKGSKKFVKGMQTVTKAVGENKYRGSVFSKYDKLLQKIGVNLDYKTKTKPTIYKK